MIDHLKNLPHIYIVFFAFAITLGVFLFTRDINILTIAVSLSGALGGIANRNTKPDAAISADTAGDGDINIDTDKAE